MRSIKIRRYAQRYIEQEVIDISQQKIDKVEGLIVKGKNLQTGAVKLTRRNVREAVRKQARPFLKTYPSFLMDNPKEINKWRYLGYSFPEENKNQDAIAFTYYKTTYDNDVLYINVKVMRHDGSERLYAITDKIDFKKITSNRPLKQKKRVK